MASESLEAIFNARESVSRALDQIENSLGSVSRTGGVTKETLDQIESAEGRATRGAEELNVAMSSADREIEQVGHSSIQTAGEMQVLVAAMEEVDSINIGDIDTESLQNDLGNLQNGIDEVGRSDIEIEADDYQIAKLGDRIWTLRKSLRDSFDDIGIEEFNDEINALSGDIADLSDHDRKALGFEDFDIEDTRRSLFDRVTETFADEGVDIPTDLDVDDSDLQSVQQKLSSLSTSKSASVDMDAENIEDIEGLDFDRKSVDVTLNPQLDESQLATEMAKLEGLSETIELHIDNDAFDNIKIPEFDNREVDITFNRDSLENAQLDSSELETVRMPVDVSQIEGIDDADIEGDIPKVPVSATDLDISDEKVARAQQGIEDITVPVKVSDIEGVDTSGVEADEIDIPLKVDKESLERITIDDTNIEAPKVPIQIGEIEGIDESAYDTENATIPVDYNIIGDLREKLDTSESIHVPVKVDDIEGIDTSDIDADEIDIPLSIDRDTLDNIDVDPDMDPVTLPVNVSEIDGIDESNIDKEQVNIPVGYNVLSNLEDQLDTSESIHVPVKVDDIEGIDTSDIDADEIDIPLSIDRDTLNNIDVDPDMDPVTLPVNVGDIDGIDASSIDKEQVNIPVGYNVLSNLEDKLDKQESITIPANIGNIDGIDRSQFEEPVTVPVRPEIERSGLQDALTSIDDIQKKITVEFDADTTKARSKIDYVFDKYEDENIVSNLKIDKVSQEVSKASEAMNDVGDKVAEPRVDVDTDEATAKMKGFFSAWNDANLNEDVNIKDIDTSELIELIDGIGTETIHLDADTQTARAKINAFKRMAEEQDIGLDVDVSELDDSQVLNFINMLEASDERLNVGVATDASQVNQLRGVLENLDTEKKVEIDTIGDEQLSTFIERWNREAIDISINADVDDGEAKWEAFRNAIDDTDLETKIDLNDDELSQFFTKIDEDYEIVATTNFDEKQIDNFQRLIEMRDMEMDVDISNANALNEFGDEWANRTLSIKTQLQNLPQQRVQGFYDAFNGEQIEFDVDARTDIASDEITKFIGAIEDSDIELDAHTDISSDNIDELRSILSDEDIDIPVNMDEVNDDALSNALRSWRDRDIEITSKVKTNIAARQVQSFINKWNESDIDVDISKLPDDKLAEFVARWSQRNIEFDTDADLSDTEASIISFLKNMDGQSINFDTMIDRDAVTKQIDEATESASPEFKYSTGPFQELASLDLGNKDFDINGIEDAKTQLRELTESTSITGGQLQKMEMVLDNMGDSAIRNAADTNTIAQAFTHLDANAMLSNKRLGQVSESMDDMGDRTGFAIAPLLVAAQAMEDVEDSADDVIDASDGLTDSIGGLGDSLGSTSLDLGIFNTRLAQAPIVVTALVVALAPLVTALGAVATAAVGAAVGIGALVAGGLLSKVQDMSGGVGSLTQNMEEFGNVSAFAEDQASGLEKIMGNLKSMFSEALEPLKTDANIQLFDSLVEGAALATNVVAKSIARMRPELMSITDAIGDNAWAEFPRMVAEMEASIEKFGPEVVALVNWFVSAIPDAMAFFRKEGAGVVDTIGTLINRFINLLVVMVSIGNELMTGLVPVLGILSSMVMSVLKAVNALPDPLLQAVGAFAGLILVTKTLTSLVIPLVTGFLSVAGAIGSYIGTSITAVASTTSFAGAMQVLQIRTIGAIGSILSYIGVMQASTVADIQAEVTKTGLIAATHRHMRSLFSSTAALLSNTASTISNTVAQYANTSALYSAAGAFLSTATAAGAYTASVLTAIGSAIMPLISALFGSTVATWAASAGMYALSVATAVANAAMSLLAINPVVGALLLIGALLVGLVSLFGNLGGIVNGIKSVFASLGDILMSVVVPAFNFLIDLAELLMTPWLALISIINSILKVFGLTGGIGGVIMGLLKGVLGLFQMISGLIGGFFQFLGNALDWIADKINIIPGVNVNTDSLKGAKLGKSAKGEGTSSGGAKGGVAGRQQNIQQNINNNQNTFNVDAQNQDKAGIKGAMKDAYREMNERDRKKTGMTA